MKAKITAQMVDQPPVPSKGSTLVWDTKMPGFGIRVSPLGRVAFVVRYWDRRRSRDQWKTLGIVPDLNLTTAREAAAPYLLGAAAGENLVKSDQAAEAARALAESLTVESLTEEWIESLPEHTTKRGKKLAARTIEFYTTTMRVAIVPALGKVPIHEVTTEAVQKLHRKLTKRRGPYAANRAIQVLAIFYTWLAKKKKLLPFGFSLPTDDVDLNTESKRGEIAAVRMTPEQEARLLRAIYDLAEGRIVQNGRERADPIGATAILALLDSGRRVGEILGLRWDRVNLETGAAFLGQTKGKSADSCYLSQRARDAIRKLPRILGSPWIFTGISKAEGKVGRRVELWSAWQTIKSAAGLEQLAEELGDFRLHDLRHHRISEMLGSGVSPALVVKQVGHSSFDQLETYGHVGVPDIAAAMERVPTVEPAAPCEVVRVPVPNWKRSS